MATDTVRATALVVTVVLLRKARWQVLSSVLPLGASSAIKAVADSKARRSVAYSVPLPVARSKTAASSGPKARPNEPAERNTPRAIPCECSGV